MTGAKVALFLTAFWIGVVAAMRYDHYRVDQHQRECASHGLVFSPRLVGGQDYCIPAGKRLDLSGEAR